MNTFDSFVFVFLILSIDQLFTYAKKCCILWQNLMLYRIVYCFLFVIFDFRIIYLLFNIYSVLCWVLQRSQHFQMSHFINKLEAQSSWFDFDIRFVRKFCDWIFIFESEDFLLCQWSSKSYIEISNVIFKNVRNGFWIRNNAFNRFLIIAYETDFANQRCQSSFK